MCCSYDRCACVCVCVCGIRRIPESSVKKQKTRGRTSSGLKNFCISFCKAVNNARRISEARADDDDSRGNGNGANRKGTCTDKSVGEPRNAQVCVTRSIILFVYSSRVSCKDSILN